LQLRDGALGTSGAAEQYVEIDGTRYGHVLDPRTGWPASGVLSASVVTRDAASADALSTAFLVGGAGLAERYCAAHSDTLVMLTPDESDEPGRCSAISLTSPCYTRKLSTTEDTEDTEEASCLSRLDPPCPPCPPW
jgi:thiamine biosynthesis lipoprotein